MSTGLRRHPLPRPTRTGSGCAWLARWLLVLVLVVDLVGAPLHAHAHDSGVDGHAWTPHVDAPGRDTSHVDDADDVLLLQHATLTLPTSIDAAQANASDGLAGFVLAWWPPFDAERTLPPAVAEARWWAAWPPPPRPEYRSRPPAGRAPPQHA